MTQFADMVSHTALLAQPGHSKYSTKGTSQIRNSAPPTMTCATFQRNPSDERPELGKRSTIRMAAARPPCSLLPCLHDVLPLRGASADA
jgi:hypothetical protein